MHGRAYIYILKMIRIEYDLGLFEIKQFLQC